MYNYVFLIGRLVREIEIKQTANGKPVADISLAINRPFKNGQTNEYDVDYINVQIWDFLCEPTKEHVHKGDYVGVKGRIAQRITEDESGNKIYRTDIIGEKIVYLGNKPEISD